MATATKKEKKEDAYPWKAGASSVHTTNLKQSILIFSISMMATDNFCFYLQNRLIQTSQTGGQWYSDTSPFSIPWLS
jgi:hypothetical protein